MILGFMLDNEPLCNSCAWGIQPQSLATAIVLDYDDVNAQQLSCSWCGSMLVDYAGLIDEDNLADMLRG
ncbi:MAG: hypothetical protein ACYCZF_17050 [Anaerolineae bacterium]